MILPYAMKLASNSSSNIRPDISSFLRCCHTNSIGTTRNNIWVKRRCTSPSVPTLTITASPKGRGIFRIYLSSHSAGLLVPNYLTCILHVLFGMEQIAGSKAEKGKNFNQTKIVACCKGLSPPKSGIENGCFS